MLQQLSADFFTERFDGAHLDAAVPLFLFILCFLTQVFVFPQSRRDDLFADLSKDIDYSLAVAIGKRNLALAIFVTLSFRPIDKALHRYFNDVIISAPGTSVATLRRNLLARAAALLGLAFGSVALLRLALHGWFSPRRLRFRSFRRRILHGRFSLGLFGAKHR